MEIKVCGMRNPENIQLLFKELNPDWIGLIFYSKSSRFVVDQASNQIAAISAKKVGVFVNEEEAKILGKVSEFNLSAVQLHGQESIDFVESLRKKTSIEIWKVVSIKDQPDWESLKGYLPFVNKFLFDTATSTHGGSGQKFDWTLLETYPFHKDFILSGGIDEESASAIQNLSRTLPQLVGVDLNSRFEDSPGVKNLEKLKLFKEKLFRS
jgi:phosphoribosylanthranilate isomerase